MSAPGIPTSFNLQTASWSIAAGATSYDVQRSTDGVTFASVATPAITGYLDTSVAIGTQYWYKVAAVNSDGTSAYTLAQSVVPVPAGEASLGQLRLNAQQRADRVGSNFVSLTEWNSYINQSLFELYDLLITAYGEEYYAAAPAIFNTNGTSQQYPLPDGVTSFYDAQGATFVPPPFYKLLGVDLGANSNNASSNNGWVTIAKFNFIDRNQYFYPNTNSTLYGVFNCRYRLFGNYLSFIPAPSAGQPIRVWYIPRMVQLLQDTDVTSQGVSGWWEYVLVDAAIKALQKEESDVSILMAQKKALKERIEGASVNRDAGQPDTISDTRSIKGYNGGFGNAGGFGGGF